MSDVRQQKSTAETRVKRKRPLRFVLFWVVLPVATLLVAAEIVLQMVIPASAEQSMKDSLGAAAAEEIGVSLNGLALVQMAQGRMNVALTMPADKLPEIMSESVNVASEESLLRGAELAVTDGELVATRTVELLGREVPLAVTLALEIRDGDIVVSPSKVTAAGFEIDPALLANSEAIAGSGGALTERTVCVRDRLPKGVVLTELSFSADGKVVIGAQLETAMLSNAELKKSKVPAGTC